MAEGKRPTLKELLAEKQARLMTKAIITEGDWMYSVSGTDATIFDYSGTATNVIIPDTLGGYNVTVIGPQAFMNNSTMVSVTIPNSVTTIGTNAFDSCRALISVTIPNSVTSIGSGAFENCTSLTTITIPNSVTTLGGTTFAYCTSLTSITIPNSVTRIWDDTFNGCTSLASVTIPNSVTSIGYFAFYECTSLTSITIPNSVTRIDVYAFGGCTSLAMIDMTSVPATIDSTAFALGTSTTPVTCTVRSPNNIADGALDAYKNEYTTFTYIDYTVTYKKLLYDDSKVQVESAVRDGLGNRIDTTYAKKGESGSINISTGDGLTGGPITGVGTISHDTSGVTAGSYQEVTVDQMGHVTHGKMIFTFTHIYLEEED